MDSRQHLRDAGAVAFHVFAKARVGLFGEERSVEREERVLIDHQVGGVAVAGGQRGNDKINPNQTQV